MSTSDSARVTPEALLAHRDWARYLARRLVRDEHAADDLAQDAMVAALVSPPAKQGAMRAWLGSVLRRKALNARRGDDRRTARERRSGGRAAPRAPDAIAEEAEAHRRVVAAVLELDERDRSVVLLRYYEDVPLPEIAERLGLPYETARARLRRALTKLRARLDTEHGGAHGWALPLLVGAGADSSADAPGNSVAVRCATLAVVVAGAFGWWLAASGGDAADDVAGLPLASEASLASNPDDGLPGDGHDAESPLPDAGTSRSRRGHVTPPEPRRGEDDASSGTAPPDDDPDDPAARETPMRTVAGVVTDADGTPISGARLRVDPWGPEPPDSALTGPTGRFEIALPDFGPLDDNGVLRDVKLSVSAKGYVQQRIPVWDVAKGTVTITLVAQADAPVIFTVVGPDGQPRAGVEVHVRSTDKAYEHLAGTLHSDARGEIRAGSRWPVGTYVEGLILSESGARVLEGATVTSDGARIRLQLSATRRIRVDVAWSGAPVAIGYVKFEPRAQLQMRVKWPGGVSASVEIPSDAERVRVVTVAGASDWINLTPDVDRVTAHVSTRGITPVTIDTTGVADLPYARVSVAFRTDGGFSNWDGLLMSLLGEDGAPVIPVAPNAVYTITLFQGGTQTWRYVTAASTSPFPLAAPQAREPMPFVVIDDAGAPLAGATLRARVDSTGGSVEAVAETGADGVATLAVVPGLPYYVRVAAAGTEGATVSVVGTSDGEPTQLVVARASSRSLKIPGLGGAKVAATVFGPHAGAPMDVSVADDVVTLGTSVEHWTVLMTEQGLWLVAPGGGGGETPDLSAFARVPVTVRGSGRFALLGLDAVADGVHAVGAAMGDGTSLPVGRYVPVDSDGDVVSIYPITVIASGDAGRVVEAPSADELEWTEGAAPSGESGVLIARVTADDGSYVEIPVGIIAPGREARWRTAGPDVRFAPVAR